MAGSPAAEEIAPNSCYPRAPATLKVKVQSRLHFMTVTVKGKADLLVPRSVRRRAGIKSGDQIEFKVSGGVISIIPKLPSALDEYTPEQRRIVNARLAESAGDLQPGRSFGPFNSAEAMIASMKTELRKRASSKKSKRSR